MNSKLILALGVALTSGAALAQSGSRENQPQGQQGATELPSADVKVDFGTLDADANRILSLDEVTSNQALSDAFTKLDADGSGGLSNAEFAQFESEGGESSARGSARSSDDSASGSARGRAEGDDTSVEEKIESGND